MTASTPRDDTPAESSPSERSISARSTEAPAPRGATGEAARDPFPPQSDERYRALVETAQEIIGTVDADGRILTLNAAFETLTGRPRADFVGHDFAEIVHPDDLAVTAAAVDAALRGERPPPVANRILARDGVWRTFESTVAPYFREGRVIEVLGIGRDVTDRHRAEEELRRRRRLLEEAEAVAQLGCWEWDRQGDSLTWSTETYRLLGLSPSAFPPSFAGFLERVHPDDRAAIRELNERAVREGGSFAYDCRILRPDGEVRSFHVRGHTEKDAEGRVARAMGIVQDATDRRRDEEVRRRLFARLISVHEDERTRISRELHDGAGQALTALLVGLRRLESASSLEEARLAAARQRELVAQTIDEVGRLARGLRPVALDDLGLRAALERYLDDQSWLLGLEVAFTVEGLDQRLPREVETALYRVVQEALANVSRHAGARRVRIRLERAGDRVCLTVADDGSGFDVPRALEASDRLGLHGIRERATLVGGQAEIRSRPGAGTTVSVAVPLAADAPPRPRRGGRDAAPGPRP